MNLQTAVAASMLPTWRSRVATAFKELHDASETGPPFLELLWAASGRSDVLESDVVTKILELAASAVEDARQRRIEAIALFDSRYPPLLARIVDPPPVLWVRGNLEVLTQPAVAIVGSRAASAYALQVGARLAGELAERGVVVASGLARGVDSAAHRGCMKCGGATIAVLGSGLERVYPPEHDQLASEIARSGLVMAELAPDGAPLPEHFPLRNRIISGISLATVVVEASERSGSLITARSALEQGREVMAVPGSVLSGRNRGSHALLKDGAKVVETADDILEELGWRAAIAPEQAASSNPLTEEPLLAQMEPGENYALDELAAATGIDGAQLLARLTELELAGLITSGSGRFQRRT
jgi:DNA processing protein